MAFDPLFKMSFQDAAGNYYVATLNNDATYTVSTTSTISYITLPEGWDSTSVTWEREPTYMGVFRSMSSNGSYSFANDARAIIQHIRRTQGIQGFCTFTIWMSDPSNYGQYMLFYQSELDFKEYSDNMNAEKLSIATIDNGLQRLLQAYGDTKYNIPIWDKSTGVWLSDAQFIWYTGIKLLYNASYISSATPTDFLRPIGTDLPGFNKGSVSDGRHWLPSMQQYNIVQNNGTTTFIGNDILQPFLIQQNQSTYLEQTFSGANESQPYTRSQYLIKNLLQSTLDVTITLNATIDDDILYSNGTIFLNQFLGIVLFEIDSDNMPVMSGGNMQYQLLYKLPLPSSGSPYTPPAGGVITASVDVTLQYDKVYVIGMVYDDDLIGIDTGFVLQFNHGFSEFKVTIASKYDSGSSGVPIDAPKFPASITSGFRIYQLLEKLVPLLASRQSDGYGFPIPVATPFTGSSPYLANPATPAVGDCVPYQVVITSSYCMHNLQGQSYVSISLNDVYRFCHKQLGMGAAIEGTVFKIMPLSEIFNSSVMILDLGYDVSDLEIVQMIQGVGANLKLGYAKADTNSDFGVDPFQTELFFNTPASTVPDTMDYQESEIVTEQYAIEKIRAQQVSQPVGTQYDPANPSTDNVSIAVYVTDSQTTIQDNYDPDNNPVSGGTACYAPVQFNGDAINGGFPAAQNGDSAATSAPYIFGMYYPDTATNLPLSPCRALKRDIGAVLHSVLDNMDSDYLTFRNTTVLQYNNTVVGLSGIESNLQVGAGAAPITEFKDIQIGSLPDQLYKPILIKVKSKYPINLYQILNTNPNGYVRFFWRNKGYLPPTEYKGFIMRATQSAGTSEATVFELIATPDMVI